VSRRGWPVALAASGIAVGVVTGFVYLFEGLAPTLSLGALYVFAVLPVALFFGRMWAVGVSVASMLLFNFAFIPPTFQLTLHGGENWLVFAVYVVTGLVVSDLAGRARQRAREAEQREREAALLAELSTTLLRGATVKAELVRIGQSTARLLRVPWARIELGAEPSPAEGGSATELQAGDEVVGSLVLPEGTQLERSVRTRFLPALASVLGFALDRERLEHEALEAEALRRSDALKTALLRSVSHDLRSPLTAIRASLEGLESTGLSLDAGQRSALVHTALVEAERLDRMVRNLLDLSRLEAGAARPRLRLTAAEGIVDGALSQVPAARHTIDVTLPGELPLLRVDGVQLERALVNLIDNAVKFSPPASRVHLLVERRDSDVLFRVVDQGPGLAPAERDAVFEPFWRGSAGQGGRGTGLGLAIARGFVEANGGRLWAESDNAGGAAFVVSVPAAAQDLRMAL
jgi:two-component system sensor histidine kinase KdpD